MGSKRVSSNNVIGLVAKAESFYRMGDLEKAANHLMEAREIFIMMFPDGFVTPAFRGMYPRYLTLKKQIGEYLSTFKYTPKYGE